jgi:hypothetical protein
VAAGERRGAGIGVIASHDVASRFHANKEVLTMNDASRIASSSVAMRSQKPAQPYAYKIALYGFGSQPIVHRHLIDLAAKQKLPLTWCAILNTPHYRQIIGEVIPAGEILDVFRALPRVPVGGDLSCLSHYPGSLAEDLGAQKKTFRRRSGRWLLDRAIDHYRLYKVFLADHGATHLLMSTIETPEEKIAAAAAQELGLGVIAPADMRNITGAYFSTDCYETPPAYAIANAESRARAAELIRRFRQRPMPAWAPPPEITSRPEEPILPTYLPSLWRRTARFTKIAMERPDIFDGELLRIALMAYGTPLRKLVRGTRALRNAMYYDITNVEALPKCFVFYPLHFTPESSVNTPAPYFVDQLRVIDAVRFAMPSDHLLAVKEHPKCVEFRPTEFMRELRKRPGVVVVKASVPAIEVIKRAALTVAVTGTTALEAFLLGRPALVLGGSLPAWAIGRVATMATLRSEIRSAIDSPPSDEYVIEQIAKLMSVRYPFSFSTPHLPGEPVLRLHNVQGFLAALMDHLDRESRLRKTEARSIA